MKRVYVWLSLSLILWLGCSSSHSHDESMYSSRNYECTVPTAPTTSATSVVVGDGTLASCTESALRSALESAAHVTFDCGQEATIAVTEPLLLLNGTLLDGQGTIILDGGNQTRILEVEYYATVAIKGITFRNGAMLEVPEGGNDNAGAIYGRDRNTIYIEECRFYDNYAAGSNGHGGGAIYPLMGHLTVVNSEFRGNRSTIGGAIHSMLTDLTLVNCRFEDNVADEHGGAVFTDGAYIPPGSSLGSGGHNQLCGCTFTGNSAGSSAGAGFLYAYRNPDAHQRDTLLVEECEFRDNVVTGLGEDNYGQGGAIIIAADAQVRSSLFAGNSASKGGAMVIWQGPVEMRNSTFVANEGPADGGAVVGWGSSNDEVSVLNCTFADNRGNYGGALSLTGYDMVSVRNTILARNGSEGNWTRNCSTALDGSNNLVYPAQDNDVCGDGFTVADPLLETGLEDGAVSLGFSAESPAQGAGVDCPDEDQLGQSRPEQGCDLGAVEVP